VDKEAPLHSDTYSFVVRIWYEALDSEGNITAWRGSIDHIGDGERLNFDDLDRVVQFIQERVGLRGQHSRSLVNIGTDLDQE